MATRYDVITPRKNGERTFWLKVGSAWESEKFKLKITLDALPLPDEKGQVVLMVSEPKARDEAPERKVGGLSAEPPMRSKEGSHALRGRAADLDDDIPFFMEWRG